MKKIFKAFLVSFILLSSLSGCGSDSKVYSNYEELNGQKVGVVVGTIFEQSVKEIFPDSEIVYYNTITDEVAGLREGKIECLFADYGLGIQICDNNEDLTRFTKDFDSYEYGMIYSKTKEGDLLRESFDAYLDSNYADYDFDNRIRNWANDKEYETFDYKSLPSTNGTIKVATDGQSFPFVFVYDNQLTGLEVEMLYGFCKKEGYGLEIDTYNFAGVLSAVSGGKADIGASGLCYTPERSQIFNFSKRYVKLGTSLIVRKSSLKFNYYNLSDLSNTTVSCISGTIYDGYLNEYAENVTYQYFDSITDEVNSLAQGKASAILINSNIFGGLQEEHTNLRVIDNLYVDNIGYIFKKSDTPSALQIELDTFLNELKESGELEEIGEEWNKNPDSSVDYSDLKNINGTIRFAISSAMSMPSNFIKDGKHSGIDIDIMTRFARAYGYDIEFQDYSFSGVLAAVTTGKADVGGSNITRSEERLKSMNFSIPYYTGYVYAVTMDINAENKQINIFDKLSDDFYKTFIKEDRYKLFVSGVTTTLLITLSSCVFGTLLGFVLYLIFRNSGRIATKLLNAYSWFITGLPSVVLLMIFYYVIFVKSSLSAEVISIIAFSILFSLAVFSILKTCFMAVDKGQYEAGYALGYGKYKTITNIIIPEIAPMFFPSYRGEIVSLIKATSIVGYIAVQDLTKVSDIVRSRTYEAFFPLIAITIIYLLLSLVLDAVSRMIERRVDTRNRKIEDIMKGVKTK